jgi:hypothetical protein
MTRDDIIRMAREAHRRLVTEDYPGHTGQLDPWTMALLERFAALLRDHLISEGWRQCARGTQDPKVTHLNEWARDRLARHGIQIPEDEEYGNPSF